MTHSEHAKKAGVSTPCTAHDYNFGGGCLNCGWKPPKTDKREESMNIKEIAYKLMALRESMSAFILTGKLRESIGFEGYGEALARRWIVADQEGSGMVQVSNNLGTVAEIRLLAEEYLKEEECTFCHKSGDECKCQKCPDCKKANCKCESLSSVAESAHLVATAHAFRTKPSLNEIATMGLGNPDRLGTPPTQPSVSQPPAPTQQPTTASPAHTQPVNVGSNVRVVQDGKTYVGRISAVKSDGKFSISFGGPEQPAVQRDYDKTEVTPVDE